MSGREYNLSCVRPLAAAFEFCLLLTKCSVLLMKNCMRGERDNLNMYWRRERDVAAAAARTTHQDLLFLFCFVGQIKRRRIKIYNNNTQRQTAHSTSHKNIHTLYYIFVSARGVKNSWMRPQYIKIRQRGTFEYDRLFSQFFLCSHWDIFSDSKKKFNSQAEIFQPLPKFFST